MKADIEAKATQVELEYRDEELETDMNMEDIFTLENYYRETQEREKQRLLRRHTIKGEQPESNRILGVI